MNLTVILTSACDLACTYCYERGRYPSASMSSETAMRVCEFAASDGGRGGISFFGGEPLLRKELIYQMIERCGELGDFRYNITTNGLNIDEQFLRYAAEHRIKIALSHDGLAHDICRVFSGGSGSSSRLSHTLDMVNSLPESVIMLTFTPQTVSMLADSVAWLFDKGARSILASPDGRPSAGWTDSDMELLSRQYELIASAYEKRILKGDRVQFPSFDLIISDRVNGMSRCNSCRLGYKQPIVFCDGSIYPCIQFTPIEKYRIGDVFTGFDENKRLELYNESIKAIESCVDCAVADRCRHSCPCANFEQTGCMTEVSAFTCTHQRMLIDCADRMAERIFAADSPAFNRHFTAAER